MTLIAALISSLALLALLGPGVPLVPPLVPQAAAAEPAPVDAGLATMVTGEVKVEGEGGGKALPLEAFMKIRVGDTLSLGEGASVQLVFFSSGVRETWTGPATLQVEEAEAKPKGKGSKSIQPVREEVGGMVGHSLETLPGIMRRAEIDLAGQRKIRGSGATGPDLDEAEQAQLAAARERYLSTSANAARGDILPHMSFASLCIELGQYEEATLVLTSAAEHCPECEAPKQLKEWLESRTEE